MYSRPAFNTQPSMLNFFFSTSPVHSFLIRALLTSHLVRACLKLTTFRDAMKQTLRVLIVEDSEFDAQMITSLVRKSGYEVVAERVETREAMSRTLREKKWDIILSDYNLPSFSAPEALKILQESRSEERRV